MEKLVELGRLLDTYGAFLTEHQRELLEQSVNEDCSLSEIAEREGISRQGVRDALKKAEAKLLHMEAELKLLQLRDGLRHCMEQEASPETRAELKRLLELSEGNDGI